MIILVEGQVGKGRDFGWDCIGHDDKHRNEVWEQMRAIFEGYMK